MQMKPVKGHPSGWPRTRVSIAKLIEMIPDDGCLIIFNVNSDSWRVRAANTGVLSVTKISHEGYNAPCDLYIYWRDK